MLTSTENKELSFAKEKNDFIYKLFYEVRYGLQPLFYSYQNQKQYSVISLNDGNCNKNDFVYDEYHEFLSENKQQYIRFYLNITSNDCLVEIKNNNDLLHKLIIGMDNLNLEVKKLLSEYQLLTNFSGINLGTFAIKSFLSTSVQEKYKKFLENKDKKEKTIHNKLTQTKKSFGNKKTLFRKKIFNLKLTIEKHFLEKEKNAVLLEDALKNGKIKTHKELNGKDLHYTHLIEEFYTRYNQFIIEYEQLSIEEDEKINLIQSEYESLKWNG